MTNRPTLILIPGLACNEALWQPLLQPDSDPRLTNWNPRVTGVHTRFLTIETMATALLDEHPGDVILCGASMGGMLAMEAARQAPGRVKGLAILGSSAQPETDDMRQLREGAIRFFEQGRVEEVLQFNLPLAFHPSRAQDKQLAQTYLDMVLAEGALQLIRQNRAVIARPDARLHLPAVACPILVLCGDGDALTPPERSREIAGLVPKAQFTVVGQCGHMLTLEQPQAVGHTLGDWLDRNF